MSRPGFSNPDTPCGDCICLYAECLIMAPLRAVFCFPLTCCAYGVRTHQEKREERGEKIKTKPGTVEDTPPAPEPPMVGDATMPSSQWPADWHHPQQNRTKQEVTKENTEPEEDKKTRDKVADGFVDGVDKLSKFPFN
ncbi:hypothetical protein F5Y04DRAFT_198556 [Hypomontagnella monticulosa]|nr:hypothetical protein F5Y04DRAFT_198556 [Hypomontagnella monticulosa]